jgi:hypothetical protein
MDWTSGHASRLAGPFLTLVNGCFVWYGLGKEDVDGLPFCQSDIELVFHDDRTTGNTKAASCALAYIDIARGFSESDLKVSRFSFNTFDITKGNDLNIFMPADLDQSGSDRSHRTIIGGKRLIELRHDAPDRGLIVDQVNLDATGCQVEGSRHPAYPGADD